MAEEDLELDIDGEEPPKKSKKLLFIIIGAVLVLVLGGVGAMFALGMFDDEPQQEQTEETADAEEDEDKAAKEEEPEELADDAIYWPIEPPFVMNFEGRSKAKYMQIRLVAMSRSKKAIETLKKHMTPVRNELTFLLGSQKYVEMVTPEGKEQLRSEIIETINTILKQNGGGAGVKTVYFTSFVMQ